MRPLESIVPIFAVLALYSAFGCSTRIGATYDPFVIFPATAQWTWDEGRNRIADDPSMKALNIEALVRETATEALAARGYTLAPVTTAPEGAMEGEPPEATPPEGESAEALAPEGGTPEFRVHYELYLGRLVKESGAQAYASIRLTLVEAATDRTAWVGFIKADAEISRSDADRRERLRKEMDQMLKGFPPAQPN